MMTLEEATQSDLSQYDTLIFGAPIYAGSIKGKEFLENHLDKNLSIFMLGMSNPAETDFQAVYEQSLTPDIQAKAKIYHLRAGMDYKRLNLFHKVLMWMMKKLKFDKVPASEQKMTLNICWRITLMPLIFQIKYGLSL